MKSLGLAIIVIGVILVLLGLGLLLIGKIPFLGNLPGDLHVKGKGWSFSFPILTCVVVSIVLTIILNIVVRLFGK